MSNLKQASSDIISAFEKSGNAIKEAVRGLSATTVHNSGPSHEPSPNATPAVSSRGHIGGQENGTGGGASGGPGGGGAQGGDGGGGRSR